MWSTQRRLGIAFPEDPSPPTPPCGLWGVRSAARKPSLASPTPSTRHPQRDLNNHCRWSLRSGSYGFLLYFYGGSNSENGPSDKKVIDHGRPWETHGP